MRYKNKFTLVELVVVVAIIAIIAALLMPAAIRMINNAKKARAKAEMNAIITAITSYESTYGVLPVPSSWANGDTNTINSTSRGTYDYLMELLTGVAKYGTISTYKNVRNIRFLDVPSDYTSTNTSRNGYRDPWFYYYKIYMDTNYDGQIDSSDAGGAAPGGTLYGTVFIYSTAGTTNNSDTVYSWKTKN